MTFELRARLAKVLKMLALLPTVATAAEASAQADVLASWDGPRRIRWARAAGVNPPSDETWAVFVGAARMRRGAVEMAA